MATEPSEQQRPPSLESGSTSDAPESAIQTARVTLTDVTKPTHDRSSLDVPALRSTDSSPPQDALSLSRQRIEAANDNRHRRFSLLRFRNASDPQLSLSARRHHAKELPPMPSFGPIPSLQTTTPPTQLPKKKRSRISLFRPSAPREPSDDDASVKTHRPLSNTSKSNLDVSPSSTAPELLSRKALPDATGGSRLPGVPPPYDDHESSVLALPASRVSESSRSDASSGIYASTTTTTHTIQTTTTFFRLGHRKKNNPESLLPLAHLSKASRRPGPSGFTTSSPSLTTGRGPLSSQVHVNPPRQSTSFQERPTDSPITTFTAPETANSGQSSPTRSHTVAFRGRSSTFSSIGRDSTDDQSLQPTSRTSSSTGRKSFGDLLGLNRLRQNSELGRSGTASPATPGSTSSKKNSMHIAHETAFVLPERREDDTPAKYLARLEKVVSRGVVASLLSRGTDAFTAAALRSYMRSFSFFGDPMDMAIRKLLMEAELPKETQQIDRCLQAFANRYHECNPGVYSSPDQAYFIAFSLLILHTDVFNKNNKHKMQKQDYLKNTRGEGIFDEILECFYDNITYTPFIHVEDDIDINGERIVAHKSRKRPFFSGGGTEPMKRASKEQLDPYNLIIEDKLSQLRPSLKEVMYLDDHYSYLGTASRLNLQYLQKTFFRTGILQIISARSRPDAFLTEKTATNPEESHPGIVDIKITKVGLLWRKDVKKKKTRSPWQEWGAILTGAQLYFFRNTAWIKNLMSQYDSHIKQGHDGVPVTFKPPLDQFKPDGLMSTDGAVALIDATYKKHKHAFIYVRHGGFEEVLLADSEESMNDWLAKLNYAAAFRTSGVRMRGVVGGNYEGQNRRGIRRLDEDSNDPPAVRTSSSEVSIARSHIDQKMAEDILLARREIMQQKVSDANEKLTVARKQLDLQLRNARHLQTLAPIQTKTREGVLLAAARMSAQLKWTRVEMWRLQCHRDILVADLEEEERAELGLSQQATQRPKSRDTEESTDRELTLRRGPSKDKSRPSSAPEAADNNPQSSESRREDELPPIPDGDLDSISADDTIRLSPRINDVERPQSRDSRASRASRVSRNSHTSHTSRVSQGSKSARPTSQSLSDPASTRSGQQTPSPPSSPAVFTTPPSMAKKAAAIDRDDLRLVKSRSPHDDADDEERDLLRQAGLLEVTPLSNKVKTSPASVATIDKEDVVSDQPGSADSRLERNKVRRSLQRTLRESAGHLSHHRSRKGKDVGGSGSNSMSEETLRDEILTRGSGSFVVHGKKASVINFPSEFQTISNEESLRQRRQTMGESQSLPPVFASDEYGAPSEVEVPSSLTPHRGSAASSDAVTARKFRGLNPRRYSSAQASRAVSDPDRLVITVEDDSDVASSFSDGRSTLLVPDASTTEEEREDTAASRPQSSGTPQTVPGSVSLENAEAREAEDSCSIEGGRVLPPPDV